MTHISDGFSWRKVMLHSAAAVSVKSDTNCDVEFKVSPGSSLSYTLFTNHRVKWVRLPAFAKSPKWSDTAAP